MITNKSSSDFPVCIYLLFQVFGQSITAIEYDTFVREWKAEELVSLEQVKDHSTADKSFLLTSNHILDLTNRVCVPFVSSNTHIKTTDFKFTLYELFCNSW